MKRLKTISLSIALLFVTLSQQSCMGSFQLTNKLYDWNSTDVGGKWGSELVFVALIIIPVYEVALLADGIILNSIEFWSGKNPMTMKDGEKETVILQKDDDTYEVSMEHNKIYMQKLTGSNMGEVGEFIWDDVNLNWTFVGGGQTFVLGE